MFRPALRWTRLVSLTSLLVGVGYAAMVLCLVAPPSPAQEKMASAAYKIADPYFVQSWQLFAPNPPDANTYGWYQIAYVDASGRRQETDPRSLNDLFVGQSQSQWVFPDRVGRIVTSLDEELVNLQHEQIRIDTLRRGPAATGDGSDPAIGPSVSASSVAGAQPRVPDTEAVKDPRALDGLQKALDAAVARAAVAVRRVASPLADELHLPGRVVEVRIFVTTVSITRFSDRYRDHPPSPKIARVGDSHWLAYLPKGGR
ncbi:DUF5819 family protein [Embleya sp. NPDC005575]|uniref:DUF5819 family protein n=1 Tax=Embleya sp. NPDC005575 TaxID=3156892 RepID=UPI00339DED56